jgi:hypothetical protein
LLLRLAACRTAAERSQPGADQQQQTRGASIDRS